jgi:NADPH-dependent 2,4-dienoyl-CoA reductase/sulfur reductase-like enzyme/rhodanese-related sulfurtransferase
MMGKTIIIGGVAGGASAAARLRRLDEQAQIILLESGSYISFANCGLPYYIGDTIKNRGDLLVMTREGFQERFSVDVRTENEVVAVNRKDKTVEILDKNSGESYIESYDNLVIATGSTPMRPPIDGIDGKNIFTLWNMNDTDMLKEYLRRQSVKNALVVGGGFIGLEMAENLRELDIDVTLGEMASQCMTSVDPDMAEIIHAEIRKNDVTLMLEQSVQKFEDTADGKRVTLGDGKTADFDLVILCMGVKPNSALAMNAGLELNERGGIVVNEYLKTSDANIYAVGDVIEVKHYVSGVKTMIPLAGPANKQGRIAADNIFGAGKAYKGSQGSGVAKIFSLTVASTGMNTKQLEQSGKLAGEDFFAVKTHSWSHASYYPGAKQIALKLLYGKDGKILGAQAAGREGVDKRIDVIATAIRFGGTVNDLTELELCYAPPFASAKDPVNIVGFMAENQLSGKVRFLQYDELPHIDCDNTFILDVREEDEVKSGSLSEPFIHIPLGQLRRRFGELDRNKRVVIMCVVGLRAYVGSRILTQNGFEDVYVYAGGYTTYKQTKALTR